MSVTSEKGLCVAGNAAEARAGARVIEEGGNAVDALVASAFAAFVVEPWSCGLGGYGHLAVYLADRDELVTFDHYLRAPGRARPGLFEVDDQVPASPYGLPQTVGRLNKVGPLAVGVPGAVAGLCAAHRLFGRLPLPQVLEPAIECADAGLTVTWEFQLAVAARSADLLSRPDASGFLLPGGAIPARGATLDLAAQAATLRRIARLGPRGFYEGPVAEEVAASGGILDEHDLAAYQPKVMRERPQRYRDTKYVTANDQVGYEVLNILEAADVARLDPHGVVFRHLMAEALGHAFVDNATHYGDPEHVASPVAGLASAAFGRARAAAIRTDRAAPRPIAAGDPWPYDDGAAAPGETRRERSAGGVCGTSQVVAADEDGNVAALCTSLSDPFGALVYLPESGVFLNNGMGNFDPRPERANAIRPGSMPIFAVPALIATRDGRAVFAAAGSGGYRITTGVVHTFVGVVDFGLPLQEAVALPRVHCQGDETFVDSRIPASVRAGLVDLGHEVVVEEERPGTNPFGRICAIQVDEDGGLRSGSNPAWATAAAGVA